jgi:hypothetical protein
MATKSKTKKNTAKKLTLRKRLCKIGTNINVRTELHGESPVPACDISLKGVMLSKDELNILLSDEKAHDSLFKPGESGDLVEPTFAQHFKPFTLIDEFEGARVTLTLVDGQGEGEAQPDGPLSVELDDVSIKSLKLEPQVGGLTSLNLQVQATPTSEDMAKLIAFVDTQVHAAISFGKRSEKDKRQKELDMGEHTEKNADAGEDDDQGADAE